MRTNIFYKIYLQILEDIILEDDFNHIFIGIEIDNPTKDDII